MVAPVTEVVRGAPFAIPGASAPATNRVNNFDLIRLFGALQVAVVHGITHLDVASLAPLAGVLGYLPGVPIFFAVSGFLVSLSWERAPSWRQYAWNRALRIYPAMWMAFAVSLVILLACGVRPDSARSLLTWVVAQLTIAQFYNPDFARGFGVGVINGSMWTIPVELQFYIAVPFLAFMARRLKPGWWLLAGLAGALLLAVREFGPARESLSGKLLEVTLLPWLFYFLLGVVLRFVLARRRRLLEGKALLWLALYAAWIALARAMGFQGMTGNMLNPVSIVLLSTLTISAAFTLPTLAERALRGNDISYGLYIYHMPFVNLMLFLGLSELRGFALALTAAIVMATLSWLVVELPALGLKNYSMRGLQKKLAAATLPGARSSAHASD